MVSIALTDLQRKTLWEMWLGGEIRANYFAELCGKYQGRQQAFTWAILVASSGSFLTLLTDWTPTWVRPVFAAVAAALSLWLLVEQNQRKATECADLHLQWNTLAN